MDLYDSPIGRTVEALQDAGREVWVSGWTDDGARCLIIDADNNTVSVAHRDSANSLGRWECSKRHHDAHRTLYAERFPRRD